MMHRLPSDEGPGPGIPNWANPEGTWPTTHTLFELPASTPRCPLFFVRELAAIRSNLDLSFFCTLKGCCLVCDQLVMLRERFDFRDLRASCFCCQRCLHVCRQCREGDLLLNFVQCSVFSDLNVFRVTVDHHLGFINRLAVFPLG